MTFVGGAVAAEDIRHLQLSQRTAWGEIRHCLQEANDLVLRKDGGQRFADTAALGGHVARCEDCALIRIALQLCRNRHCPQCQWRAAERWLKAREAELLPVPYFHVVFTLPAAIGAIAYQNKVKVYGLLYKAAAETLTTIAADPKHLGAEIGLTAVGHTTTSGHHPHVHCIAPGGGVSSDGHSRHKIARERKNRVSSKVTLAETDLTDGSS
jgi:hypothetical protein